MEPTAILDYWFSDSVKKHWFSSTHALDKEIRNKYETLWKDAAVGKYDQWKITSHGCLALTILLDQFPLNMYRGKPKSFSTEQKAVEFTLFGIDNNFDLQLEKEQVPFLFMPLMHSENINHQDLSVELFRKHGLWSYLEFAEHHKNIVGTFGRFPHRNAILGRSSTDDEIEYLNSDIAFKG